MKVEDEAAILDQARQDPDGPAFRELVSRHQSSLRNSLRYLCGWDESLADDIAQETFIRAYRNLPGFRVDARFSTWLYRIAINLLVSHHRRQKERSADPRQLQSRLASEAVENGFDLQQDLASAMSTLPIEQRIALHLCLYNEYTHSEVADIMQVPLGTAKSHIARGKARLQKQLRAWQSDVE